jgi:hypothetical protein
LNNKTKRKNKNQKNFLQTFLDTPKKKKTTWLPLMGNGVSLKISPTTGTFHKKKKNSIQIYFFFHSGLTKVRNKKFSHSRTKLRNKFDVALKKQRGAGVRSVDKSKPYAGESSGIRTNVTRSRSLRDD